MNLSRSKNGPGQLPYAIIIIILSITILLGSASITDRIDASSNRSEIGQPDRDCLFNPSLPKCIPGPEVCPEEFAMNSHEQCVPKHAGGCPEDYHSHENDESGRCIPDNIPCNEGYIINPDYPECQLMEQVCNEDPNLTDCTSEANALQNSSNAMLDS